MSKQRNQKTLLFSNMHSTKSNFNSTRTYFQNRISKRGIMLKVRMVATVTLCSKIVQIDSANISKLPTTIYRLILLYFLLKDKKKCITRISGLTKKSIMFSYEGIFQISIPIQRSTFLHYCKNVIL